MAKSTRKNQNAPGGQKPELKSEIVTMKVADLIPYDRNPRDNSASVEQVKKSLEEFGYLSRIIVDKDGIVVAGHTRLKAMKELGWSQREIEVIRYDAPADAVRAYRLVDNKVAEPSKWIGALLTSELNDLDDSDYDLSEYGFDTFDDEDIIEPEVHEIVPFRKAWILIAADIDRYDTVLNAVDGLDQQEGIEVHEILN